MKACFALCFGLLLSYSTYAQYTIAYAYDANGNRVKRIPPPPDLVPAIGTFPGYVHAGSETISLVVKVYQLASVPTTGLITVYIAKDLALVDFTFTPTATLVGIEAVQNGSWTLDTSDADFYQFTTSAPIGAKGVLKFGLTGIAKTGYGAGPGGSGPVSFSALVLPVAGELNISNNSSATTMTYFPN